jgi:hypothetical protein
MIFTAIKNANLALAFFLELAVLAALGYWGISTGQGTLAKIGLGIGVPAVAVVAWALFGAPRSVWRLQGLSFLILRVVCFGSAAFALFAAGQRILGVAFALVCVINLT